MDAGLAHRIQKEEQAGSAFAMILRGDTRAFYTALCSDPELPTEPAGKAFITERQGTSKKGGEETPTAVIYFEQKL